MALRAGRRRRGAEVRESTLEVTLLVGAALAGEGAAAQAHHAGGPPPVPDQPPGLRLERVRVQGDRLRAVGVRFREVPELEVRVARKVVDFAEARCEGAAVGKSLRGRRAREQLNHRLLQWKRHREELSIPLTEGQGAQVLAAAHDAFDRGLASAISTPGGRLRGGRWEPPRGCPPSGVRLRRC